MHFHRRRRVSLTDLLALIASMGLVLGVTLASVSTVGIYARSGAGSFAAKIKP